jgi:error-prone DNA polymerase
VKGLSNREGALIPLARAVGAFSSVEDVWRRAGLSDSALERLADADAYGSLGVNRRDALWAIRGLNDKPLPLFVAADDREGRIKPENAEPNVTLVPMTEGREVVEDYLSKGLTLRQHPVAFLRAELAERRIIPCSDLKHARDGRRLTVAGLVLVRQKPGSAKGVTFMTIEDETEVANLVIWSAVFEKHRRLILSSGMIGCRGRVQREGEVIHLVAEHLIDLSDLLRSIGERGGELPRRAAQLGYNGEMQANKGIKVQTRDFR